MKIAGGQTLPQRLAEPGETRVPLDPFQDLSRDPPTWGCGTLLAGHQGLRRGCRSLTPSLEGYRTYAVGTLCGSNSWGWVYFRVAPKGTKGFPFPV